VAYATGQAAAIGLSGSANGFTQVLYEFTTAAANNGSDFLGTTANTPFWNIATGIVILAGRYLPMGVLLALGGSMLGRKRSDSPGLRTDTVIFSVVLIGSILVLVVLTFFPFLSLGPILGYLQGKVNFFGP
jgi:K+-transporting ATPase ATPase A chain